MKIESDVIGACLLGAACYIAVIWLLARVLHVCDHEIKTDFETLTERNRK